MVPVGVTAIRPDRNSPWKQAWRCTASRLRFKSVFGDEASAMDPSRETRQGKQADHDLAWCVALVGAAFIVVAFVVFKAV